MADATQRLDYPALLDFPAPQVRSYPPATVIAEKFQAMVALGVLNGRMKDYYDLGRYRARSTFPLTIWMRPSARHLNAAGRRSQRNAHQASRSRCLATKGSSGNGVLTPHRSN